MFSPASFVQRPSDMPHSALVYSLKECAKVLAVLLIMILLGDSTARFKLFLL
jgi:hypothetical protein